MRRTSELSIIVLFITLLGGCYGVLDSDPELIDWSADSSASLPEVPVTTAWVDSLAGLPADELFDATAQEIGVPADLLRALAWTESGFAAEVRWLLPDDERLAEGHAVSGLPEALIASDRAAHLAAGAARLAALELLEGADLDDDIASAEWLPVVAAFAGVDEPWLADAYAAEVFAVLQRGTVAFTVAAADLPEADVVVIAPRTIDGLEAWELDEAPSSETFESEYPPAIAGIEGIAGTPRDAGIDAIVVVSGPGSWARAVAEQRSADVTPAHYLVRRADGAVTQLAWEGRDQGNAGAITVQLAALPDSHVSWTPQLLEGASRLSAYLMWRHDLPIEALHADVGEGFPSGGFALMTACFAAGGEDCATGLTGSSPDAPPPPSDDEARSAVSVPYHYQYANSLSPTATCQNTSIAMVLNYAGWSGTPDDITARFGKDLAQSPAGLAQVFNTLAGEAGLEARLTPNTSGSVDGLRSLLNAGKPTIVHGYMTGYGHVLVATGYDGASYTANDPAGKWAQTWKGGYPYGWNASVGKGIRYGRSAFEQAVATSNGSTYLPLWYHELTGVSGSSTPEPDPESESDPGSDDSGSDPGPGGSPVPTVTFLQPTDGAIVGDPLLMRARRTGGGVRTEFWSDAYLLGADESNPSVTVTDIYTHGLRNLEARSVSEWGTVLANHKIRVDVQDTGDLTPSATHLGGMTWRFGASTDLEDVGFMTFQVDGWLLTDDVTGSSDVDGPDYDLTYTFTTEGIDRVLTVSAYTTEGDLLATGSITLNVSDTVASSCFVAGMIECGRSVEGNTSHGDETSDVLNGYPDIVGNYEGNEVGYRFLAPSSGEVEFFFVDPDPATYNLDIILLDETGGLCQAGNAIARGFNNLVVEVQGGREYTVVVDGFAGDAGWYQLMLDCSP
ncbi:MAG: hypothetical protein GY898_04680 [Proteobacteria bacterium]|nr:hypothetical protein [Pseudomonadota bacterium]